MQLSREVVAVVAYSRCGGCVQSLRWLHVMVMQSLRLLCAIVACVVAWLVAFIVGQECQDQISLPSTISAMSTGSAAGLSLLYTASYLPHSYASYMLVAR
jgi:hypothetical protein